MVLLKVMWLIGKDIGLEPRLPFRTAVLTAQSIIAWGCF